jgi:hypothetical protein
MTRRVDPTLSEAARRRHARPVLADPDGHSPLRVARVQARKRIVDVARDADMTPRTVARMEHQRSPGTKSSRKRVARALGVPVADLFER